MMEKNERYTGGPAAAFYHSLGGVANVTHLLDLEPPVPTAQLLLSFVIIFNKIVRRESRHPRQLRNSPSVPLFLSFK